MISLQKSYRTKGGHNIILNYIDHDRLALVHGVISLNLFATQPAIWDSKTGRFIGSKESEFDLVEVKEVGATNEYCG